MKRMKVVSLVLDFDLYPRPQVNSQDVGSMVLAEKAGAEFPPILIDKKSKRVIDGFHRCKKQLRVYGPDAEIDVVEKTYRNSAEMLLDAIKYNANHGRKLNSFDRTHALLLADNMKISIDKVAGALSMTVEAVESLRLNKSASVGSGKLTTAIAIKRTIGHMAGKKLTKSQIEANKGLGGMNQLFYVNQLITLIEANLIDKENEDLIERMRKLHGLLEEALAAV